MHPFVPGRWYVARESFRSFNHSEFVAGHAYEFQHVAYSHYDSSTVFTFKPEGTATLVEWWWHDDELESLCAERFQQRA